MPAKRSLDFSSPLSKTVHNEAKKLPDVAKKVSDSFNADSNLPNSQISLTPALPYMDDLLTPVNGCYKRTAEDLFGDIADMDLDDLQLPSKKQKTEEENDLDLIDRIIESRKVRQMLLEPTSRSQNQSEPVYDVKENLSVDIPR